MNLAQTIELSFAIVATLLNLGLIPIILLKSSTKMGNYKYYLLVYTSVSCYYSFCVSTLLLTWFIPQNGFLFIATIDILPRWFQVIQIHTFDFCFVGVMTILASSFLYRLSILQNVSPIITPRTNVVFVCIGVFAQIIIMGGSIWLMSPTTYSDQVFREEMLVAIDYDINHVAYVGGPLYVLGSLNVGMITVLVAVSIYFTVCISICIYCWFEIGSRLRELRRLTSNNYKHHHSCYVLLTFQTCLPVTFTGIPVTAICTVCLFGTSFVELPRIGAMFLAFAQILDPLFTIYLITDYRNVIIGWKKKILGRNPASVSAIGNTTTTFPSSSQPL